MRVGWVSKSSLILRNKASGQGKACCNYRRIFNSHKDALLGITWELLQPVKSEFLFNHHLENGSGMGMWLIIIFFQKMKLWSRSDIIPILPNNLFVPVIKYNHITLFHRYNIYAYTTKYILSTQIKIWIAIYLFIS